LKNDEGTLNIVVDCHCVWYSTGAYSSNM